MNRELEVSVFAADWSVRILLSWSLGIGFLNRFFTLRYVYFVYGENTDFHRGSFRTDPPIAYLIIFYHGFARSSDRSGYSHRHETLNLEVFRHPGNLNLGEFSLMPLCIEWTRIVLRSGLVLLSLILKKRFLGWLDSCGESPHYLMLMHSYILPFGVLLRTLNAFQRPWCFLSQGKLNHLKQDLIFQLTHFKALLFPNLAQTFIH